MFENIKRSYLKYEFIYFNFRMIKKIRSKVNKIFNSRLSDKEFIKKHYKKSQKRPINLENPQRFTEKIQWLKLYDRDPLKSKCADKLRVREYIKETIGDQYLINLLYSSSDTKSIPFNELTQKYIIKTNHGSGTNIIVKNGKMFIRGVELNFEEEKIRRTLKKWLSKNFYCIGREWEYKNIIPMIIIEELMKDESGNEILNDYKVHCFNGHAAYIQIITDRLEEVKENWYDVDWQSIDANYFSDRRKIIPKPSNLDEIIAISEKLSKGFKYVRIDLYSINQKIYFGEMTFHPAGGFMKFYNDYWDIKLGELITEDYDGE